MDDTSLDQYITEETLEYTDDSDNCLDRRNDIENNEGDYDEIECIPINATTNDKIKKITVASFGKVDSTKENINNIEPNKEKGMTKLLSMNETYKTKNVVSISAPVKLLPKVKNVNSDGRIFLEYDSLKKNCIIKAAENGIIKPQSRVIVSVPLPPTNRIKSPSIDLVTNGIATLPTKNKEMSVSKTDINISELNTVKTISRSQLNQLLLGNKSTICSILSSVTSSSSSFSTTSSSSVSMPSILKLIPVSSVNISKTNESTMPVITTVPKLVEIPSLVKKNAALRSKPILSLIPNQPSVTDEQQSDERQSATADKQNFKTTDTYNLLSGNSSITAKKNGDEKHSFQRKVEQKRSKYFVDKPGTILLSEGRKDTHDVSPSLVAAQKAYISSKTELVQIAIQPQVPPYKPPNSHTGRVYQCEECKTEFILEDTLKRHMNRRSALFTYTCSSCKKLYNFYNRCQFLIHIRMHDAPLKTANLNISMLPASLMNITILNKLGSYSNQLVSSTEQNIEKYFKDSNILEEIRSQSKKIFNGSGYNKSNKNKAHSLFDGIEKPPDKTKKGNSCSTNLVTEILKQTTNGRKVNNFHGDSDGSIGLNSGDKQPEEVDITEDCGSKDIETDPKTYFIKLSNNSRISELSKTSVENISKAVDNVSKNSSRVSSVPEKTVKVIKRDIPISIMNGSKSNNKAASNTCNATIDNETTGIDSVITSEVVGDDIENDNEDEIGQNSKKCVVEVSSDEESLPDQKKNTCRECNIEVRNLANHYKGKGLPSIKLKCKKCCYLNPTPCALSAHMRIHEKRPPFICPDCAFYFIDIKMFHSHIARGCFYTHKTVRYQCPKCCILKGSTSSFVSHLQHGHVRNLYKCDMCSVSTVSMKTMQSHVRRGHRIKSTFSGGYCCHICPDLFVSEVSLPAHLFKHASDAQYLKYVYFCPYCKLFTNTDVKAYSAHLMDCYFRDTAKHNENYHKKDLVGSEMSGIFTNMECANNMKLDESDCTEVTSSKAVQVDSECVEVVEKDPLLIDEEEAEKLQNDAEKRDEFTSKKKTCVMCLTNTVDPNSVSLFCTGCVKHLDSDDKDAPKTAAETRSKRQYKCRLCKESMSRQWITIRTHYEKTHHSDFNTGKSTKLNIHGDSDSDSNYTTKKRKSQTKSDIPNKMLKSAAAEKNKSIKCQKKEITKDYECIKCHYRSKSLDEFRSHIEVHKNAEFQCLECGECFIVKPSLEKHLIIVHSIKNIKEYFVVNNIKRECLDESYVALEENQCRVCFLKCDSKQSFDKHMRVHGSAFVKMHKDSSIIKNPVKPL